MKVLDINLPGYMIEQQPKYELGKQVDVVIEENFDTDKIVIRAISSSDHPKYSIKELSQIIQASGTDKYDPNREGIDHEVFDPYKPDFQAEEFNIDGITDSFFGGVMRKFYELAPTDRGYPLKIDLLLIYDKNQVSRAGKIDENKPSIDPRFEKYLYRFKNPDSKRDALLGIISINS